MGRLSSRTLNKCHLSVPGMLVRKKTILRQEPRCALLHYLHIINFSKIRKTTKTSVLQGCRVTVVELKRKVFTYIGTAIVSG